MTIEFASKVVVNGMLAILFCQAAQVGRAAEEIWPLSEWSTARPTEVGMDVVKLRAARDYALTGGGSGYVTLKAPYCRENEDLP